MPVRTVSMEDRKSNVFLSDFASVPADGDVTAFLDSLPKILQAEALKGLARHIALGTGNQLWMIGGHIIKTGLAPLLIWLMERGKIGCLAGNGAVAIHDWEIACWGRTSEDVASGIVDGTFGMTRETGQDMNKAIRLGAEDGLGMGEALGRALEERNLEGGHASLLLAARRFGIPFTIHPAIGCEVIHQHPEADGGAIGSCGMADFRKLAGWMPALQGGTVLNLGSAVIMPEVFLKALTVARNLNQGAPRGFLAADFDMVKHYRPWVNVCQRPTDYGKHFTGHHEIMIPLLVWAIARYGNLT